MRGAARRALRWTTSEGGVLFPEEVGALQSLCAREQQATRGVVAVVRYPEDCPTHQRAEVTEVCDVGENLILATGREALRELQAVTIEDAVADVVGKKDLGFLAVGDGVLTPEPGTTALVNELTGPPDPPPASGVVRPQLQVTAPPPGPPFTINLWTAQIGSGQLNGETLREVMLFCLDNTTPFAARNIGEHAKTAAFAVEIRWSIVF